MVLAFPQVGNWLAWLVGNGREVRVGEDPWLGSGESFKLSKGLVLKLRSLGIFTLNQAFSLSLQRETLWKNSEDLGLEEGLREEWNDFVSLLKSCFIHLEEEEKDNLFWTKNPVNGDFMAKLGYKNWSLE